MGPSPQHNPVSPEALELGYQPESAPVRGLFFFLVFIVAGAVILHVLLWWLMKGIDSQNAHADTPRSVMTESQTPPPPQLQPSVGHDATEHDDLVALRRREDEMFTRLGWTVRPGAKDADIPPDIVQKVADEQRARAAAAFVPPTTTGRNSNSILPAKIPASDTQPSSNGGQQP